MKMYALLSIGVMVTVSLLSGCEEQSHSPQTAPVTAVSYINVTSTEHNIDTQLQGRVSASMEAEVRPQVSGIIEQRLFSEGQLVEQGQTLYQIDPEPYQAAYNEAKATLNSAKAVVASAKLKDERYTYLLSIEGVSQQDADDARAAYLEAKANIEMYEAALETARINLEYTKVVAPISGRIGISNVTQGALVTAQQETALATIRTLNPIYVDMTKNSKALLKLRKLMREKDIKEGTTTVTLTLEDGNPYEYNGELKMQEVAVDASTGAVTLRAEFPNPDGLLLPGMFVRASVTEAIDENAILVPQQGIYHDATGEAYAYVIDESNIVEKRAVETINAVGNQWLLESGLTENERLLVEGAGKVRPGSEVNPVQVKMNSKGSMVTVTDPDSATASSLGSK